MTGPAGRAGIAAAAVFAFTLQGSDKAGDNQYQRACNHYNDNKKIDHYNLPCVSGQQHAAGLVENYGNRQCKDGIENY